jgi:hypothetical protein
VIFHIPNPWFESEEQRRAAERFAEKMEAEINREAAEHNAALSDAVAAGNMSEFNAAMPTTPSSGDVLARALPVSRVAAQRAKASDDPISESEIADNIFADETAWGKAAAAQSPSGEDKQRSAMAEYLKSPNSRGMRTDARKAAKLWVEGVPQTEIAKKIRRDQSTVLRMIQASLKLANQPR